MAWDYVPTSPTTDTQAFAFLIQFWKAISERECASAADLRWPRSNFAWGGGTVDSITQNIDGTWTLTDSSQAWNTGLPGGCSPPRWYNYSCASAPWLPLLYDVIIEADDDGPLGDDRKVIRAQITDNTDTELTLADLTDYITANVITGAAELEDKRFYIVKRDGLWWQDENETRSRWLEWPNDQEYLKGSGSGGNHTSTGNGTDRGPSWDGSYGYFTDSRTTDITWDTDQWVDYELLVYAGGLLQRITITANNADTFRFATQADVPSGSYIVVTAGGIGFPGRPASSPHTYYRGAIKQYIAHHPDDTLGAGKFPDDQVTWETGFPVCVDSDHDALDVDLWTDVDEECGAPSFSDHPFSGDLYKTIRGLQVELERIAPDFVEAKDYTGETDIHNFTKAEWFHAAGINSNTATIDYASSDATFTVSEEYPTVYYTILSGGEIISQGTGAPDGDGIVSVGDHATWDGYDVVYSAGWSRYFPHEFTHMWERSVFIPDVLDDSPFDPPVIYDFCCDLEDPPPVDCCNDCFGTGRYEKHDPSEQYKIYSEYGIASDTGDVFAEGDVARYSGDSWADPGVNKLTDDSGGDTPYFDRFYEGQHLPAVQTIIQSDRTGTATGGGKYYLEDTTKHWWSYWYSGGTLRTESGTATGGSTTSLEIEAAKVDDTDPLSCWWDASRFSGFGSPYEEFILEVDKVVSMVTTTYYLPITSVVGRNVNFTAVAGLTVSAGDAYRIKEPKYTLNRYKGMPLVLTDPDGNDTTVTITHSDDQRLYFAAQTDAITDEWSYSIQEPDTGGVWTWTGTAWEVATGDDPRGQPFRKDPRYNLPHKTTAYGRMRKGDYFAFHIWDELYRALNVLLWTQQSFGWTANSELNYTSGGISSTYSYPSSVGGFYTDYAAAWAAAEAQVASTWPIVDASSNIAPFAEIETAASCTDIAGAPVALVTQAAATKCYAYPTVSPNVCLPSEIDFWCYAGIDAFDSDEGLVSDWPGRDERHFNSEDSGMTYRTYALVSTVAESSDPSRMGSRVGTTYATVPEFDHPPDPQPQYPPDANSHLSGGFVILKQTAILKWTFKYAP